MVVDLFQELVIQVNVFFVSPSRPKTKFRPGAALEDRLILVANPHHSAALLHQKPPPLLP